MVGHCAAAAAPAFASACASAGATEDLVYLLQFGNPSADDGAPKDGANVPPPKAPANGVAVYNVTTGEWRRERGAPPVMVAMPSHSLRSSDMSGSGSQASAPAS